MSKDFFQKVLLAVFSMLITFLVCEGAYRIHVLAAYTKKAANPDLQASFFSDSLVTYDPQYGYSYKPNKDICILGIEKGLATSCLPLFTINEFATFETDFEDFKKARENTSPRGPRVLVFGDSFTSIPHAGETWVSQFSKRLKEKQDPNVQVLNFGRDGYGVLQMLELAASQIDTWKPDMILIAYITDDLHRRRFWRKTVETNGRGYWYLAYDPADTAMSPDSQLGQLFDRRITKEWCSEVMKNGGNDPLIPPLESFFKKLWTSEFNKNDVTFFMPRSFLFNKIVYGQPVLRRASRLDKVLSYRNDAGLEASLKKLEVSGVPYYFVHFPMIAELEKGTRWIPNSEDRRLASELMAMAGQKRFFYLKDYMDLSKEQLARFPVSPQDGHPSADGIRYIADAMTRLYPKLVPRKRE
ncbi:MAG: SGNH/GDSL hydrolase family protein [Candidatus Omnitrophota bacterium]